VSAKGFFTQAPKKQEFYPFLAKIKEFIMKEIGRNYEETTGQRIDKKFMSPINKFMSDFLSDVLIKPV
jgi:hypothetical protein